MWRRYIQEDLALIGLDEHWPEDSQTEESKCPTAQEE